MAISHGTPDGPVTGLRATLEAAMAESGHKMKDSRSSLTRTTRSGSTLPPATATASGSRGGSRSSTVPGRSTSEDCTYVLLGEAKPDGVPYTNSEADWAVIRGWSKRIGSGLGLPGRWRLAPLPCHCLYAM